MIHTLVLFGIGALFYALIFATRFDAFSEPANSTKVVGAEFTPIFTSSGSRTQGETVTLPNSTNARSIETQTTQYRFLFSRPETNADSFSIYIPAVKENATLYLNSIWLAQAGPREPYLARLWNHPQLFTFPTTILNQSNELMVEVITDRTRQSYLSPLYIGETSELTKHWEWRNFVKVTLLELASVLLIVAALVNMYLWTLRPGDSYYLWYALAALFWGIRGYLLAIPVIPISDELRIILRLITLGYGVAFVVLFNQRYFGYRNRLFDAVMWIYCVPMVIPMFFLNMDQLLFYGHQFWVHGNLLLGVLIFFQLLLIFFRQRNLDAIYLLYSGMPLLVIGCRDMLVLNNLWTPHNGFLINHLTLPALIVAMWFIIRRLSDSLALTEQLNLTLEQRVIAKEEEVRASYRERENLRRQQLLGEERERIMRDMHDGIGGHLIGIKSLMDDRLPSLEDVRDYIDRALIDLRFIINSLDPSSQTLTTLLGSLRARWQQLSELHNQELIWRVSQAGRGLPLGPAQTLQIMRILEEVFANALRHGAPRQIVVETGSDPTNHRVWLKITNSIGSNQSAKRGRGINNIRRRAADINAELEISSDGKQHSVRLVLPPSPESNLS